MKRETGTWRWGVEWRDEKLYIFEPTSVLVMKFWPEMRAWRKTAKGQWKHTRKWADKIVCEKDFILGRIEFFNQFVGPRYDVLAQESMDWVYQRYAKDQKSLSTAFGTIPSQERQLASQFIERRWHLLALMARCPGAKDLVEANPALAFALASNWVFHRPMVKQPLRAARSLIIKKQVEIQSWLGFPPSETLRRILAKIDPAALTARKLLHFQWRLAHEKSLVMLSHLQRITPDMFRFLCDLDARERIAPRVYHQLAELSDDVSGERSDIYSQWLDGRNLSRVFGLDLPSKLNSIQQIHRWHDALSDEHRHRTAGHIRPSLFGPAPFPGNQRIRPILTGEELLEEGEVMKNCVASLHQRILDGNYFVYRVEQPVRATLSIIRRENGWEPCEIKGLSNTPISAPIDHQIFNDLIGVA